MEENTVKTESDTKAVEAPATEAEGSGRGGEKNCEARRCGLRRVLEGPASLQAVLLAAAAVAALAVFLNGCTAARTDLARSLSQNTAASTAVQLKALSARVAELESRAAGGARVNRTRRSDGSANSAAVVMSAAAGESAAAAGAGVTFGVYSQLPEEIRTAFLKEHMKAGASILRYLLEAPEGAPGGEAENAPAALRKKALSLYAVWNALENDEGALRAADRLLMEKEMFGCGFSEAADVAGLAVLQAAIK